MKTFLYVFLIFQLTNFNLQARAPGLDPLSEDSMPNKIRPFIARANKVIHLLNSDFFTIPSTPRITNTASMPNLASTPRITNTASMPNLASTPSLPSNQNIDSTTKLNTSPSVTDLIAAIQDMKEAYLNIDRQSVQPDWLYESQFLLRMINQKISFLINHLTEVHRITTLDQQQIEFTAQTLQYKDQSFFQSPQKELPIYGVKGSDWPLERWQDDPEFYKYEFDNTGAVLFRGLQINSGDILLNHPIERPVGIFTAITEQRSVYAHTAMVVILNRKQGRLPVVVEIHERGIRAVPLHYYLGPNMIGYTDLYRFENPPENFTTLLETKIIQLLNEAHPYDLSGSNDRKALSCTEMISYILELTEQEPLPMKSKIADPIYKNILRFGKIDQQLMQVPNDVFLDSRFKIYGYIDNTVAFRDTLINEVLLDLLREALTNKTAKESKNLSRLFGEIAIDQVHNERSIFGGFILNMTGFTKETFPVGDRGLLSAVNAIDNTFSKAMKKCTIKAKSPFSRTPDCLKLLNELDKKGPEDFNYSIHKGKRDAKLRAATSMELKKFYSMFE